MFNFLLAAILINGDDDDDGGCTEPPSTKKKIDDPKPSFWANLKSCFSSKALGSVIASMLIFSWVNNATSYSSMGSYYEDMYGVEPHHRGYIQSYQQVLAFLVQSALVGPLLKWVGGERKAACLVALLIAITTFCEMQRYFPIFLLPLIPAISLSTTLLKISLRALLTTVVRGDSIFSIFAALDVLQNVTQVTVPRSSNCWVVEQVNARRAWKEILILSPGSFRGACIGVWPLRPCRSCCFPMGEDPWARSEEFPSD
jgi:hypothetical protein